MRPLVLACANIETILHSREETSFYEKSLKESEARGRAILEGSIEAIITIDQQGLIEDVNPATERLFGYKPVDLIGNKVNMLMPEPYCSQHDSYISQYLNTGVKNVIGQGREVVGMRRDGSTFPMELAVNHITVSGRNLFTGVIRDISEQKERAEQLKQLNADLAERVNQLNESNSVNILLNEMSTFFQSAESVDEVYQILLRFCEQIFQYEYGAYYSAATETILEELIHWGDWASLSDFKHTDCWAMRLGVPHFVNEVENKVKCRHYGDANYTSYLCIPVMGREGPMGLLSIYTPKTDSAATATNSLREQRNNAVLTSIAERFGTALSNIKLRERLHQDSTRDSLTSLFNRRFFDEAIELEFRRFQRSKKMFSLVMVDADHFKSFNDEYGHEAGDLVLTTIAKILVDVVRDTDIPCRFGGEEFAVILPQCDHEMALLKAEEIRSAIEHIEIQYHRQTLRQVTVSCGIATVNQDAETIEKCILLADKCLYKAKALGRNCVVHVDQLN